MASSKVAEIVRLIAWWRFITAPFLVLAVVLCAAGCAIAPVERRTVDGVDTGDTSTTPDTAAPDAAPAPDARPLPPPKVDAPPVAAPDAGTDSAALQPDGRADAGQLAPSPDAGDAGAPGADSAPSSPDAAPSFAPVCTSTLPACAAAQRDDDRIRATFTQPCTAGQPALCGGVTDGSHIVETLPLFCVDGQWRLDGAWSGAQWVTGVVCSHGCGAAGATCAP